MLSASEPKKDGVRPSMKRISMNALAKSRLLPFLETSGLTENSVIVPTEIHSEHRYSKVILMTFNQLTGTW
jgi:hypothetical protein